MNEEDKRELAERRLVEKIYEAVEHRLVRRYSIFGAIAAIVVGSLVTLVVKDILYDARVKLETAERLQALVSKQLADASSEAKRLTEMTETSINAFSEAEREVQERFEELGLQAERLTADLAKSADLGLGFTNELRSEVDQLTRIVAELVSDQIVSDEIRKDLEEKVGSVKAALAGSGEEIVSARTVAELIKYPVEVRSFDGKMPDRDDFISQLQEYGFSTQGIVGPDYTRI